MNFGLMNTRFRPSLNRIDADNWSWNRDRSKLISGWTRSDRRCVGRFMCDKRYKLWNCEVVQDWRLN